MAESVPQQPVERGLKFKRGTAYQTYDVFDDGRRIGEVFRYEQRFDLRRVVVIRGWRARDVVGTRLPLRSGGSDYSCFKTRGEAAEALVDYLRES